MQTRGNKPDLACQDTLVVRDPPAARSGANNCRLNSAYAHQLDTLEVHLNRDEFSEVVDYINTILCCSPNLAVLILDIDRPPQALQRRAFAGVHLEGLWAISVDALFGATLLDFMRRHQASLRYLRFLHERGTRAQIDRLSVGRLPILQLTEISGSASYVASALKHCAHPELYLKLCSETSAKALAMYQPIFQQHYVTSLLISLRPRDFGVVRDLATYFPHLQFLKIVERHRTNAHVWTNVAAWSSALREHTALARLALNVPHGVAPDDLPIATWFPADRVQMRSVELTEANDIYVRAWRRDHGTGAWVIVP
ncbi:hypothetical protein EV714DRAFT_240317 [Schizophyllum commune]